jgi:hypothetical protein
LISPAELVKHGGIELKRRIHKLIMKMWEEETLPTEWTEGIICLYIRMEIGQYVATRDQLLS